MKNSKRVYNDVVRDMLDAAQKAETFLTGVTFEDFQANAEKVYAVIHALTIIGEAAKRLPSTLRSR